MRKLLVRVAAGATLVATAAVSPGPAGAGPTPLSPPSGPRGRFVVLAPDAAHLAATRRAVTAAGGIVVEVNRDIGVLTVDAPSRGFTARLRHGPDVAGVALDRRIGAVPGAKPVRSRVEQEPRVRRAGAAPVAPPARPRQPSSDPLESRQWDMHMIRADDARAVDAGSPRVLVGVIDTGIDASHPDLAANVDTHLSRNFTVDRPEIDGPCEVPSCKDPATVDDGGHGTHVAGTIAAAANGIGIVGVAPKVRLVNLRAGQDSGFFFLVPTLNALTTAGDIGVDVVNMSFYVDPWLYNCAHNQADLPDAQYEQRTIVTAVNRALDAAHDRGVTLVSAMGNEHSDLARPGVDLTSPDFPANAAYARTIDNADCLSMPSEGHHVLNVTSLGPSGTKADYSSYGVEHAWVGAPGGWTRDGFGTPTYGQPSNTILSTYPRKVLQEEGSVDPAGNIVPAAAGFVFKECNVRGACGYYTYLQGTSMASPHAAGVAALAVDAWGSPDRRHGGLTLAPDETARVVASLAAPHACPQPPVQSYAREGRDHSFDALCEGSARFNGFYGFGIVDALATVTRRPNPPSPPPSPSPAQEDHQGCHAIACR